MNASQSRPGVTAVHAGALLPGARIHAPGGSKDLGKRISLSAGTAFVCGNTEMEQRYLPGAFVPLKPWREPDRAELELLDHASSGGPWRPGTDGAVSRIDDDITERFASMLEECGVREHAAPRDHALPARHPRWRENMRLLERCVGRMCSEHFHAVGLRLADPAQLTLTQDVRLGEGERHKRVGLHIDSWDNLPLRLRGGSRNRLCINFSREPRYSLFINLPLWEMFKQIGLRDPEDVYEHFRGRSLDRMFAEACPHYPVVRLRIDPGEAYILPTENLVHDGSTEGNRYADISLTFLGHFSPGSLANLG